MASCVLCATASVVFCSADQAFLCSSCDSTIHAANVISAAHKRVPVCELCKRVAASVYCEQDAASLCSTCESTVHQSNPLPHTVLSIEEAMESGKVVLPIQMAKPGPTTAAVEQDEVSCTVGHRNESLAAAQSSEANTSMAVVPEATVPTVPAATAALPTASGPGKDFKTLFGKEFDGLDFEATWLGGDLGGLDFSDILNADNDAPGMVPTLPEDDPTPSKRSTAPQVVLDLGGPRSRETSPAPAAVPTPTTRTPALTKPTVSLDEDDLNAALTRDHDHDFVVPSFLPLEEDDGFGAFAVPQAGQPTPAVINQFAHDHDVGSDDGDEEEAEGGRGASKRARLAMVPNMILAPPPPPLTDLGSMDYGLPHSPVFEGYNTRRSAQEGGRPIKWDGANMTREQRVARYREKRKNRTFQKTIRYASRKAYAEVRPRIKGRFATKEEVEAWKARQAAGIVGPEDHLMTF